jgi:DNA-binding transcriptional LysR family regulator
MDTMWLAVFREVAAHGSLTGAAHALGYTQSAVSRQIAALEAETGARLLDRQPRGVQLTEEGRLLLEHAAAVLDRLSQAQRDLDAVRGLAAGRLRVGGFDSADAVLVPQALAAFQAEHPLVALSLVEGPTPVQLDRLRRHEIDLAVVSAYPGETITDVHLHRLLEDPMLVAIGRPFEGAPARLADFAGERWIEGYPASRAALVDACARAGFQPRIDFAVRDWTAKQGLVAAGLGVALVPSIAAPAVRRDLVLVPLVPEDAPVRTIFAAVREKTPRHPAVGVFLRYLRRAAAALPGGIPRQASPGR